jgi:hypothetical protein
MIGRLWITVMISKRSMYMFGHTIQRIEDKDSVIRN